MVSQFSLSFRPRELTSVPDEAITCKRFHYCESLQMMGWNFTAEALQNVRFSCLRLWHPSGSSQGWKEQEVWVCHLRSLDKSDSLTQKLKPVFFRLFWSARKRIRPDCYCIVIVYIYKRLQPRRTTNLYCSKDGAGEGVAYGFRRSSEVGEGQRSTDGRSRYGAFEVDTLSTSDLKTSCPPVLKAQTFVISDVWIRVLSRLPAL